MIKETRTAPQDCIEVEVNEKATIVQVYGDKLGHLNGRQIDINEEDNINEKDWILIFTSVEALCASKFLVRNNSGLDRSIIVKLENQLIGVYFLLNGQVMESEVFYKTALMVGA